MSKNRMEAFSDGVLAIIIAAAIPLALLSPLFSCFLYVLVAILWLVPDRRIEGVLKG